MIDEKVLGRVAETGFALAEEGIMGQKIIREFQT